MSAADPLEGATHDGLVEWVAAVARSSGRDKGDLMACALGELQTVAQVGRAAVAPAEQTDWDRFLRVLGYVVQVAGPLASVAGAFAGVFSAAKAGQAL